MKRIFGTSDESIPECVWQRFPEQRKKLQRIIALETNIDKLVHRHLRVNFAVNADQDIKKKILRVFIHHKFNPSTPYDRSHFLILVEGHVLDNKYMGCTKFGQFFEKVKFQVDKRLMPQEKSLEWSSVALQEGSNANCFQVKLYGDKPSSMKIFFHRSSDVRPRYELDTKLRAILPNMQLDPTEEDVMLAVWQYILSQSLCIEIREKKHLIRYDEVTH